MLRITAVEPTVFIVRQGNELRQLVRLQVQSEHELAQARLVVRAGALSETLELPPLAPGSTWHEVYLPDLRAPQSVSLELWAGDAQHDERRLDWQPVRHWEVYLVHYSHHDLGYTDLPTDVLREHAAILDDVVHYAEETADWPEDERFHFLVEQAWSVLAYLDRRPPEDVARLVQAIRCGQVEVTALYGNMTSELCGHEELIRLLYPAFALKRRYGIEIASAEHNDIPGLAWGLASTLAGAGVRYLSPGVPLWYFRAGEQPVHPLWDEAQVLDLRVPGAFWWEGPDGARVLLWYDLHGHEWHPTSYAQALRELPVWLHDAEGHGYPYDLISFTLRGGHRDNAPAALRYAHIARAWNQHWAYPRLINANNTRFLRTFEQRCGATLKTLRGDVPGTDYAAAATCTPHETALNRRTHDDLLTGEKLATLAHLLAQHTYPRATLDEAYRNSMIYDEHCWGMADPGGPAQAACWSEKGNTAYRAAALAHDVTVKAANRLADVLAYRDQGYHLTLFNSLSWEREAVVRVPLRDWHPCGHPMYWQPPQRVGDGPLLLSGGAVGRHLVEPPAALLEQPFELVDLSTGQPVVYQLTRLCDPQAATPWAAERMAMSQVDSRYALDLVFVAEGLPALGYKTYRIVPCERWPEYARPAQAGAYVLTNPFYALQVHPQTGAVLSLVDRELGRELVDPDAPHGFAQLLARRSAGGREELARTTELTLAEDGPVFTTLRAQGALLGAPSWTREITLYHGLKRVEVNLRLLRDATPNLELYLAFPLGCAEPHWRYEAAGAVIEPLHDQLPGTNTDYYAVQHWVEVANASMGLVWSALDAPMAEFGGLWPGYVSEAHHGVTPPGYGHPFLREGELTRGHLYSLLSYANFRTNFVNVHPGEVLWRYALGSRGGSRPSAWAQQFGWGAATPPVAVWMKGPQAGILPPASAFCRISVPNVMLLTLKMAEDGHGLIARLMESEGRATEALFGLPRLRVRQAVQTNLVEEDLQALPVEEEGVRVNLSPCGVTTLRLLTE